MNITVLLAGSGLAAPQLSSRDWASLVGQRFRAERDVVYKTVEGRELKLDLYIPYRPVNGPAVFYIHGGGWQTGSKEQYVLWYLPYLELGLPVVAVGYRLSGVAPAPAAVEDCRCALRWVAARGAKYGIDPQRLIVTGGSAGGHLALLTALGDASLDGECPQTVEAPRAAAVVNYYGPTDLTAFDGTARPSLDRWLAGGAKSDLARRLSPVTWVKKGGPPVLSIHGDADKTVPYGQAVALHRALSAAGVPNELVTVPGGAHGRHTWSDADTIRVQRAIESFLRRNKLLTGEPR